MIFVARSHIILWQVTSFISFEHRLHTCPSFQLLLLFYLNLSTLQEYGACVISTIPTVPYIFEYSDGRYGYGFAALIQSLGWHVITVNDDIMVYY